MEVRNRSQLSLFLQLSKPYLLLIGIIQSCLGAGIARYLGHQIDWMLFWFGVLWVLALQLGMSYLHQYFDLYVDIDRESGTWFFGGSQVLGTEEGKLPRRSALVAAMGALGSVGAFTVMIFWQGVPLLNTVILMLLIFLAGFAYAVPPLQLSRSGYGELLIGLAAGFLIPAFSFELHVGGLHRLVTQTTLPIVLLIIPAMIALSFPAYSTDLKKNRANMLSKIGWEYSILIHNSLILIAYLFLAAVMFIGLPRGVGLTAFIAFPLGLLQIWLMNRIAIGAKPVWRAVTFNAVAMVSLFVGLILYSYWIG